MDRPKNDITRYIFLSEVVGAAAMDTYADFSVVERMYSHWAARGLHKLTNETFKTGKRQAIIPINKMFNSATIDCDFVEALFVGAIDPISGEKIPFHVNHKLINTEAIETIPDDIECEAKCTGCYSKALCNDLQTTEVLNVVTIGDTDYNETVTTVLQPDGTLFVTTETPFYNNINLQVEYRTKKEIKTTLDLAPCGCIQVTPDNTCKIHDLNYGCYCTYCSPVCGKTLEAGYKIFPETSTIKFDNRFSGDNFYFEWRGSLPKRNGEYIVPAIAKETLINLTKYMSIANKKGIPQWQIDAWFRSYVRERDNMDKARGSVSLHDILYGLTATPSLAYHL